MLYLTHSAGFKHDVVPYSETVLQKLGQTQGWDVLATKDVGLLTAATLKDYAAVVFYTTGELPITDQQKADLLAYIKGGGALVGVHSATDTFYKWPEYGEIMGGYFDNHPWHEEVGVIVEDRTAPGDEAPGRTLPHHRRDLPASQLVARQRPGAAHTRPRLGRPDEEGREPHRS